MVIQLKLLRKVMFDYVKLNMPVRIPSAVLYGKLDKKNLELLKEVRLEIELWD